MNSESEHSRSSVDENSFFAPESIQSPCMTNMLEANDVCEELLSSKINAMQLNDEMCPQHQGTQSSLCDGSDSGVDIAMNMHNISLQRALSNNSGGYASSTCGGLDDLTNGFNGNTSCNSSMISYSSDLCELKAAAAVSVITSSALGPSSSNTNYECCSENGSESSSVAGGCVQTLASNRKLMNSVKKKVAMFEPHGTPNGKFNRERELNMAGTPGNTTPGQLNGTNRTRSRLIGISRTASLPRHGANAAACMLQTRDRARSREKSISSATNNNKSTATGVMRHTQIRAKPQKPDTLPAALTTNTVAQTIPGMQRIVQRTPSLSRARTPGTPSDDGRWPSTNTKRGLSATPDLASLKMRANMLSMDAKSNPYGTMPRRRKQKSVEDLTGRSSRSSSTSRDPFSNPRMVSSVILSSRRSLANAYGPSTKMLPPANTTPLAANITNTSSLTRSKHSAMPKTKIYHETSAQTAITSLDLEKMLAGAAPLIVAVDATEFREAQTQSDLRDKELERLHDEIRILAQRENELTKKLNERTQRATQLELQLKKEREEKVAIQRELHLNTERVMGMLELARVSGTPTDDDGQCDSLLMLESQIQMSGHELHEKQQEIGKLRKLCRTLQTEMERSLLTQESLLQEKVAIEQESNELHDFLQHEKAAMCDALKEIEQEYQTCKRLLVTKDEEIKVLRDECRHLVRLNEQRRQENRLLQSKYAALENKSKELIVQQNSSVSGASMSLSGLHSRLDSLVEQLVSSYNISEQDLEDMVFPNEATTNGSTSIYDGNNSDNFNYHTGGSTNHGLDSNFPQPSDGSLSPQRNQSFIAAVISAIRHATTPSGKKLLLRSKKLVPQHEQITTNGEEDSDSTTEMLDSETEPCLMMDNVLEDVTMPDSHSHNMVSSTTCTGVISQAEAPSELVNAVGDESLQNLSQAITNRQQMEFKMNSLSVHKVSLQLNQLDDLNSISEDAISCHDSVSEMPSLAEYCSAQTVVDQVIEVDTIVTKLLKVLRLIQMDNDSCIQQLILDKNKLQQNKEDMLEKLKDMQDINIKLKDELMDATQELMLKNNDLSSTKAEIQRHRNEIDRLTQDICNLSTLCSNYKKLSPTTDFPPELQNDIDANAAYSDSVGILNLLKMWHHEGQLQQTNVRRYLQDVLLQTAKECEFNANSSECLLDNVLKTLNDLENFQQQQPELLELRKQLEQIKVKSHFTADQEFTTFDKLNANGAVIKMDTQAHSSH